MKKVNVLFVNLPPIPLLHIVNSIESPDNAERMHVWCPSSVPLGLMYISSYMKKHCAKELGKVAMLDYAVELNELHNRDYKKINDFHLGPAAKIDFKPDIIAIAAMFSTSYPFYVENIKKLKELWPGAVTVVGGIHATNYGKRILAETPADYFFAGEGEIAFSRFITGFANEETINIKGVYFRENYDKNTALELTEQLKNLDELPFPDRDLVDMVYSIERSTSREITSTYDHRPAVIMTSRGCPFMCTYCSAHTVHGRKMRCRSVENVIGEIKFLFEKYGVNLVIPVDDMFTVPRGRALEILREIPKLGIAHFALQFPNALSVNSLDEELIDELVRAGMTVVSLSIESGSEYVQKHIIKKNCNLKKAREIVKYFKSKNVIVKCCFIMGFFGETKEHMRETVEYIKSIGNDWTSFYIAVPLIGSDMYKQFLDAGYIHEDNEFWTNAHCLQRGFDTPEITARELTDFIYMANLECNFLHNVNIIEGKYEKAIDIFKDILVRYPFHIVAYYCIMNCYKKLGNDIEAKKAKDKIFELIQTDSRSKDLITRFGYLMPEIKI